MLLARICMESTEGGHDAGAGPRSRVCRARRSPRSRSGEANSAMSSVKRCNQGVAPAPARASTKMTVGPRECRACTSQTTRRRDVRRGEQLLAARSPARQSPWIEARVNPAYTCSRYSRCARARQQRAGARHVACQQAVVVRQLRGVAFLASSVRPRARRWGAPLRLLPQPGALQQRGRERRLARGGVHAGASARGCASSSKARAQALLIEAAELGGGRAPWRAAGARAGRARPASGSASAPAVPRPVPRPPASSVPTLPAARRVVSASDGAACSVHQQRAGGR